MANLSGTVGKILAKQGQPATLSWGSKALNRVSTSPDVQTSVFIDAKSYVGEGNNFVTKIKAYLPITERDIVGATLTTGGKSYKVIASNVIPNVIQEAQLV